MQIIDGRALAAQIKQEIKDELGRLGMTPGLAVILVGDNPASHLYVSLKEKASQEVRIKFEKYVFAGTEPQSEILAKIQELNTREDIHGILVQVPLPAGYDEDIIISQIDPGRDVDGFHQVNLRAILAGEPRIFPAVALAIVTLVDAAIEMRVGRGLVPRLSDVKTLENSGGAQGPALQNKKAVLLVNRTEFAAPVEYLLNERGAKVEIILRAKEITRKIAEKLRTADIMVVARGRAGIVTGGMIKNGAIVIDAGTNKLPDGRVVGDVDFASTQDKTGFITPVPGGVGPMTVAMLLKNTAELCRCSATL